MLIQKETKLSCDIVNVSKSPLVFHQQKCSRYLYFLSFLPSYRFYASTKMQPIYLDGNKEDEENDLFPFQ